MDKINILFAASECSPFIKTGGLADVAAALPLAVSGKNYELRVIMPKYSLISQDICDSMEFLGSFNVSLAWRNQYCGLYKLKQGKITYYFVDNEYYFKRAQAYGQYDDGERFAFFSKAVCESVLHMDFEPNIIHCNDWHTALVPVFLREFYMGSEKMSGIKTIFTIHNLKFQGLYSDYVIGNVCGLNGTPAESQLMFGQGGANYMKAALIYSDLITTVSPSYAKEICTEYYGEGLDDVLRNKGTRLVGILNGIDSQKYNPKKDNKISVNYDIESFDKKAENKLILQKELALDVDKNIPMFSLISRLTEQKGMDLVNYILPELVKREMQFVVLGIGDAKYEEALSWYANKYPKRISFIPKFDEGLSQRIYAASDCFVMPSRFEPCGLSQMMSMAYGTLPIVRETGGLKDSVSAYNKYTGEGNGFSFTNFNADELLNTIDSALTLWYENKEEWNKLAKNAMAADYSWKASAKEYKKIYRDLT